MRITKKKYGKNADYKVHYGSYGSREKVFGTLFFRSPQAYQNFMRNRDVAGGYNADVYKHKRTTHPRNKRYQGRLDFGGRRLPSVSDQIYFKRRAN